jgi:hypothetical protein
MSDRMIESPPNELGEEQVQSRKLLTEERRHMWNDQLWL